MKNVELVFDEVSHTYTNKTGNILPSVTQIIGTVYGTGLEKAPKSFVERAGEKGTRIHKEIETYLDSGKEGKSQEFKAWLKWFNASNAKMVGNYESEKIIYAKTPNGAFAGTADFLCDGWLWDWKTCKTATRKQIDKWQKQLSFYTYALRQMGYAINEPAKIMHLTDVCEVIHVDYLGDEFVEKTMALYKGIVAGEISQEKAIISEQKELETVTKKDFEILADVFAQIKALETVVEDYREKIRLEMERRGILNVQMGDIKVAYIQGTIRQTFDTKAFRQDDPDLYAIYLKDTEVKPSIRITVK